MRMKEAAHAWRQWGLLALLVGVVGVWSVVPDV